MKDEKDRKTYSYPLLNMTAFLNEAPYHMSIIETYMDEHPYYHDLIETYRTAINDYGFEFRDINGD